MAAQTLTQSIQPFLTQIENKKFRELDIQSFFTIVSKNAPKVTKNELNDAAKALMNAIAVSK